jgi:multidrug efflux system membrane fusion protein
MPALHKTCSCPRFPLLQTPGPHPRWISLRPLVAISILLLSNGCSEKAPGNAEKKMRSTVAVPVQVAQAEAKDVPVQLQNIGNVEAYSTVTVRSQVTGQITKVHFKEGQNVKAGDLLFTIDPRPAEGALRRAQADLKRDQAQLVSARLDFERVKKLLESSIASRDDYDKAEATFHALEATLMADQSSISNATVNLEYTAIRSRIDGRTGSLMVKEGNVVKAPDDVLVTINQLRPIYVTFSVPETDLPLVRRYMRENTLPVEVEVPGHSQERARGELTFIDNGVDPATGRIKLKATFANSDDALWPGQFVQTTLTVYTLPHATVVPSQAVQSSQNGDFVFVVKPDATVTKRNVSIALSQGAMIVIERGVQAGETVVTDGQLRLAEGSKVVLPGNGGKSTANPSEGEKGEKPQAWNGRARMRTNGAEILAASRPSDDKDP